MNARRVRPSFWPLLAVLASSPAAGATLTVTSAGDGGAGTLRDAVLAANAMPGPDTIVFDIPGTGPHTIPVATPILITDLVTIDGYSQPGAAANTSPFGSNAVLQVELQGAGTDGFVVSAGTNIAGLALHGFQSAIVLTTGAEGWIHGNFIGTDVLGDPVSPGNAVGVSVQGPTGIDTIGGTDPYDRNLISGNVIGIEVSDSSQTQILSNLIGTDPSGQFPVGNGTGIRATNTLQLQIGTNTARNTISGNFGRGIHLTAGEFNNIDGNYVGTDVFGANALGNLEHGVDINGFTSNFAVARNVLSGNGGNGLEINHPFVGNIGVNSSVTFNFVGTDGGGNQPIGNGGSGIRVVDGDHLSINNNVIAHNANGIWYMAPSTFRSVTWMGNSIFSNHGLGIVLGPTPEIGPNVPGGSFNFPLLTSVVSAGGTTTIQGIYRGPANRNVSLRYYASPACVSRPQEFDEGKTFLGTGASFVTDGSGLSAFSDVLPVTLTDERVTASAGVFTPPLLTDGGQLGTFQTSGFSQRLPFSVSPTSGPAGGATGMYIHGTDYAPGASVTIGGLPAQFVTVQSPTLVTAAPPLLPPGSANDIEIVNTDGTRGTLPRGWIADFDDVPQADPLHDFVVTLFANAITGGIGGGLYGPGLSTLRQQMAVFLLKGKYGVCYAPPPCTGVFADVPCPSTFADWIEALAAEGITGGCGAGVYCPQNRVRRNQMAVFLLKAEHGSGYVPPPCAGTFTDVPCPSPFADWIEQLVTEGITAGCGGGNYCPGNDNTRGQMAVFLVKTFGLQ